jgi:hypothetical protein
MCAACARPLPFLPPQVMFEGVEGAGTVPVTSSPHRMAKVSSSLAKPTTSCPSSLPRAGLHTPSRPSALLSTSPIRHACLAQHRGSSLCHPAPYAPARGPPLQGGESLGVLVGGLVTVSYVPAGEPLADAVGAQVGREGGAGGGWTEAERSRADAHRVAEQPGSTPATPQSRHRSLVLVSVCVRPRWCWSGRAGARRTCWRTRWLRCCCRCAV